MKIHFEKSGGFAGLRLSHDLDRADLSPEERGELDRLVERAQFFDLPAEVRALNPGADRFQYRLTMKGRKQPQRGMCTRLLNWLTAKTHKR